MFQLPVKTLPCWSFPADGSPKRGWGEGYQPFVTSQSTDFQSCEPAVRQVTHIKMSFLISGEFIDKIVDFLHFWYCDCYAGETFKNESWCFQAWSGLHGNRVLLSWNLLKRPPTFYCLEYNNDNREAGTCLSAIVLTCKILCVFPCKQVQFPFRGKSV